MDTVDINATIREFVDNQTPWFEQQVILALSRSAEFFSSHRTQLCVHPMTGKYIADFSMPLDNAIYKALTMFYDMFANVETPAGAELIYIEAFLNDMAGKGDMLSPHEVEQAIGRLKQNRDQDLASLINFVNMGFVYWLRKRRMQNIIQEQTRDRDNWSPDDMMQALQISDDAAKGSEQRRSICCRFGEGLDSKELSIERIATTFGGLDTALGGGLGLGEGTLIIGPTGAGKTIMALQLAQQMAAQQNKVMFITTEQDNRELEPRVVSNTANIPYKLIKDKFDERMLNPTQFKAYKDMRAKTDPYLHFYNWMEDRSKSIVSDLDNALRQYTRDFGKPKVIILDWIGGAMGDLKTKDMQFLRLIFQLTADKMAAIAKTHGIATVSFVQANPKLAFNTERVDTTTIAECKTMGNNMTNIIGISAKLQKEETTTSGQPVYSKEQALYISKSRKGPGGRVAFIREYEFQRMRVGSASSHS